MRFGRTQPPQAPLVTGVCCKALLPFGLLWSSQGTQMSYLALLRRREHRFRESCWVLGQKVGRPVSPCGDELRRSRSPIEEDKMIRFLDFSILATRSWIPAAWVPGGLDCLAAWLPGCLAALLPCCLALLAGWLAGWLAACLGAWSVVSHARRSGEVGGYIRW